MVIIEEAGFIYYYYFIGQFLARTSALPPLLHTDHREHTEMMLLTPCIYIRTYQRQKCIVLAGLAV